MTEIRCKKCNRLLMKGKIWDIEIKCPKCRYTNRIFTSDRLIFNTEPRFAIGKCICKKPLILDNVNFDCPIHGNF